MVELKTLYSNQKSFYGKALVNQVNELTYELYSYGSLVCTIKGNKYYLNHDIEDKLLFSQTTLKHIKEFLYQHVNLLRLSYLIDGAITKKDIIKNEGREF